MSSEDLINVSSEIEKYTSLLDSYGAAVVILALFISIFTIVFLLLIRNNSKTTKQIMDQQQKLFDAILKKEQEVTDLKEDNDHKEKNLVDLFVKIDDSIKDVLKKINQQIDASRLSVYVFHNGSYSSHGLPFFKVSCINEIIKKNCGVTSKIKAHTSLPLSMFNNCIKDLSNNGKVIITNVGTNEAEYPVIHSILDSSGIKSALGVAIYDHDNNILGVIIAEFRDKKDDLERECETLIEYTTFLEPILSYSKIEEGI